MKIIIYCLLAVVFVQIVGSILAFQHLVWWQAILASLVLFYALFRLMIWIGKLFFVRFLKHAEAEIRKMANLDLLRNAQVIVHTIEPGAMPEPMVYSLVDPEMTDEERREQAADYAHLAWHVIEVTVVPQTSARPEVDLRWQPQMLSLIPKDRQPPQYSVTDIMKRAQGLETGENCFEAYELNDLHILCGKEWCRADRLPEDYNLSGPLRLRFTVGVPRDQAVVKFTYQNVAFGLLELHVPSGRVALLE